MEILLAVGVIGGLGVLWKIHQGITAMREQLRWIDDRLLHWETTRGRERREIHGYALEAEERAKVAAGRRPS